METKTARLEILIKPSDKEAWKLEATKDGRSLANWLTHLVNQSIGRNE